MKSGRVEAKVKSAAAGAGVGAAVAGAVLWAAETYVFHGEVPEPVRVLLNVAIPALTAFVLGYLARHTPRDVAAGEAPRGE